MAIGKLFSFPPVRGNRDGNNCSYIMRLLWELTELFYTKDPLRRNSPVAMSVIIVIVLSECFKKYQFCCRCLPCKWIAKINKFLFSALLTPQLTNKIVRHLKCTSWWFDLHIDCGRIFPHLVPEPQIFLFFVYLFDEDI